MFLVIIHCIPLLTEGPGVAYLMIILLPFLIYTPGCFGFVSSFMPSRVNQVSLSTSVMTRKPVAIPLFFLKRARMLYIGANIPYLYITIFLKTDKRILKITKYLLLQVFFLLQFYNCGRKCRDGCNPTGWLLFRCCIRDVSSVVRWHTLFAYG